MDAMRTNRLGWSVGWPLIGCVLALFAAMVWPHLSWAAEPRKDPCEDVLAKPGTGGGVSGRLEQATGAEQLADHMRGANPLGNTTGVAGDYYLDPAAVEMLPPGGRRVICWMARYERTLRDLSAKLGGYQADYTYRCVPPKVGRAQDVEKDKTEILGYIRRMPNMARSCPGQATYTGTLGERAGPCPPGGETNPRGAGGWIWAYMWEIRDYTNSAEFKRVQDSLKKIRTNVDEYRKELKPCDEVAGQGQTTSMREHSVWIAGNDVLVGQSDVLRATKACRLKGWGDDCNVTVEEALKKHGKDLQRVAGLYNTFEEARAFYCSALAQAIDGGDETKPRVVPATGGRDWTAKLSFSSGRVGISNAPGCNIPR